MHLARSALITFSSLPPDIRGWQITLGAVQLSTRGARAVEREVTIACDALLPLKRMPSKTAQGMVRLPMKALAQCQRALEMAANLVSSAHCVRRQMASPTPCVALVPSSVSDQAWLATCRGFQYPKQDSHCRFLPGFDLPTSLPHLGDRYAGVALLAEGLGNTTISGKYREHMRLFELAFRLAGKPLVDPLYTFLRTNDLGYTKNEVMHWIQDIRHGLTHADTREFILLEADVRPVINRVEQAAFDVLLNKEDWRSSGTARRSVWTPTSGLRGEMPFVIANHAATMETLILDDLNAYRRDMNAFMQQMPSDWWSPYEPDPVAV